MPNALSMKPGAGRKVDRATSRPPSTLSGGNVTSGARRVAQIGQTPSGQGPGTDPLLDKNIHASEVGTLPDGVQDAQIAHDLADMAKRGQGGTENKRRGPEWMQRRIDTYQQDALDRFLIPGGPQPRTTLGPGDESTGK